MWNTEDWLPPAYRDGEVRAAAFRSYLQRAELLGGLMARSAPGVNELKIAGDYQSTRLYLYVPLSDRSWRSWAFSSDRGDGTVPLWSAADSRDGNLAGSLPSFVEHATIFRDEWVKVVLRRELIITSPPAVNAREPEIMLRSGTLQRLDTLDGRLEPPIAEPGERTKLVVMLQFPADAAIDRGDVVGLTANVDGIAAPPFALVETTDDISLANKVLTFAAELSAPSEEEIYRIDIDVAPLGKRAVYLTVARA